MLFRQLSGLHRIVSAAALLCVLTVAGILWAQAPADPVEPKRPRTDDVLLRENTRLIDRTGRILCLRDDLGIGNVQRSVFQPKGELGYFILLENAFLEKLEAQTRHGERDVKISGTVTEYRGTNYLLLTRVFVRRN